MKRLFACVLLALTSAAFGATLNPVQLLNPAGSTAGQAIISTGSSTPPAWGNVSISALTGVLPIAHGGTNASSASGIALDNITGFSGTGFLTRTGTGTYAFQSATNGITYGNLTQAGANTLLGNSTGSTANVSAITVTGCNGAAQALQWTNGSGFGCNSSIATSGANSNITSLTGLTTPLSAAQGGTGTTTSTGTGSAVLSASPTFTGTPVAPTAAPGTSTTQVATTAFSSNALATYAGTVGRPYFQATLSANQAITANTLTKIQFNTKQFDSNTYYDATTNFRFTPLVAGKYRVTLHIQANATSAGQNLIWLYKNGAAYAQNNLNLSGAPIGASTQEINIIVSMNGTTDYIEGYVTIVTGTSLAVGGGGPSYPSWFEAYYIGP